jgi:hypothetical protein
MMQRRRVADDSHFHLLLFDLFPHYLLDDLRTVYMSNEM